MTTCFIFAKYLNETGCLSVKINSDGEVLGSLGEYRFSDIQTLQQKAITVIVLPSESFNIQRLELPLLDEKKARSAIPFALEDNLAQHVDALHFSFANSHYENKHYCVVVCDKEYLSSIINRLLVNGIHFDKITVDFFALSAGEIAATDSYLLANDELFQGALNPNLVTIYVGKLKSKPNVYTFTDSNKLLLNLLPSAILKTHIKDTYLLWLAKKLAASPSINICQGGFARYSSSLKTKYWQHAAIYMSVVLFSSFIVVNLIKLHLLNKHKNHLDIEIAKSYQEFFPKASNIIDPKMHIMQLLKQQSQSNQQVFWSLLNKLMQVQLVNNFKNDSIVFKELRFKDKQIQVFILTKDFETMQVLQTKLERSGVKVKLIHTQTNDKQVVSVLELRI